MRAASTSPRGSARTPNQPAHPDRRGAGARAGNLENYIASASIFKLPSYKGHTVDA